MKDLLVMVGVVIIVATVAIAAIVVPIRYLSHHYDKKYCPVKLESLNREGKFVDYNFFDWQCLVKTDNGTYVTIDRLLNVSEEN